MLHIIVSAVLITYEAGAEGGELFFHLKVKDNDMVHHELQVQIAVFSHF